MKFRFIFVCSITLKLYDHYTKTLFNDTYIDYIDHFPWHWTFQRTHSGIIILILFYCVTKDSLVLIK